MMALSRCRGDRKILLSSSDVLPNLSYPMVAVLDRADLDVLFDPQAKHLSACGHAQAGGRLDVLRHGLDQEILMLLTGRNDT